MKIVVISTTVMNLPPPGYSGLEMLAWQQAGGLAVKGHQILLVAPKESTPPPGVELHGTTLFESEQQAYSGYWQRLPSYDVVIDNSWEKWAYMLKAEGRLKAPVLGVMHAPIHTMYATAPPVTFPCVVCISQDQAHSASELWHIAPRVCYNGIDPEFYKPLNPQAPRTTRYLFLGRFSSIKGPHIAIGLARSLKFPLDMVGDDTLTAEPSYVQRIREQATATPNVSYLGPKKRDECVWYFDRARAMIHTAMHFREPFGLAPVEAQACGCPVLTFNNGAMRETVRHGETGFVVDTVAEMEDLIKSNAVDKIKPGKCRANALRFTIQKMVDRYEELCKEALETGGW